ncbi:ArsR/SmtB family transcription factor [Thermoflavimicrobium dichotomicum]|uniref:DNA-binding transcriptional regulator, ArsR family n=1 Tax=Thermoflavimicrobium dichotomicum TaxID=46223 RepID=A0A1I3U8D1_9BACL|nr:metalloregulator ArsR/SmtB family transcription factor [Thermoflavimicrobium dichotomicum]SFJ79155.1 DNA-binding transcriptional regulator, ArsR family [Thermoflavimicrobium dichotomicum]
MSERQISSTPDVCEVFCYDEEKVQHLQNRVHEVNGLSALFKALGDETRLKIAYALTLEKELCVCDIANILGSTVATASHHLRLLKHLGVAKSRKEGKLVFYSLDDDHVKDIIQIALEHWKEIEAK